MLKRGIKVQSRKFYFWYILYCGLLRHQSDTVKYVAERAIQCVNCCTCPFLPCQLIYCELESVEWLVIIFLQNVDYWRDWMWFYVGSFSNIKMSFTTPMFLVYLGWREWVQFYHSSPMLLVFPTTLEWGHWLRWMQWLKMRISSETP